jgi:hypothetical protein
MKENDYILPIAKRLLDSLPEGQEIVGTCKSCEPRMIIHKETIVGQYMNNGTIDWWEDASDEAHTKIVEDAKNIINSKQ